MVFAFSRLLDTVFSSFGTEEKLDCFHCGEKMRKANALTARFNGGLHPVCCHGCLAVLHAVERNKLVDEYLQNKSSLHLAG